MLEALLPEYAKQLLENYQSIYSQLASQLRWLHFDDVSRLVTRVGWLDDGWIRVRVDGWSALDINVVEVLRELSWAFFNIAETNKLLSSVVSEDRLRVTPYDSEGEELSRYIRLIDVRLSHITGAPGSPPPPRGVVILGFDGTKLRIVRTTPDGRLLAQLG